MLRQIPKPIHEEVMKEISQYDKQESLEKIAKILWKENPRLGLWFCIENQLPY